MGLSRRDFLRAALVGGAASAIPLAKWGQVAGAGGDKGAFVPSPKVTRFVDELRAVRPLTIHDANAGMVPWEGNGDPVPHFVIEQAITNVAVLPGRPKTAAFTYAGQMPGPTFLFRRGERVAITQVNNLQPASAAQIDESTWSTSTHLHGARVKGLYDGHPVFNRCQPGSRFTHYYPNEQEAITMWYHDHNIMDTGLHVWSGLAAFYLLTDDHEQALMREHALPAAPYDIPLVIQDKLFNPDGSIRYVRDQNDDPVQQGMFGDIILVNGQPFPKLTVEPRKYRFRLLNGSNARFYNLRLSTGDAFSVVQTDGGLIPRRADTTELFITMAERYSIVIDFSKYAGQRVVLQNTIDPDPFGDPVPPGNTNEIMAFDVVKPRSDVPDVTVPDVLNEWQPWYRDIRSVARREFRFERARGQWVINGRPYEETRMDAEPVLNSTEIWTVVNKSGAWLHPVHMHLVEYRMLERNGRPVKNYEQGPKDVIGLGPGESVKVAINFDGDPSWFDDADALADRNALVYPMHCHNLEHEDNDMMTQFRVVRTRT